MSTLSIGVSGLNAAMVGITTTSHNIANVSTPGYNRQVVIQASNGSLLSGAGFVGQGTHVDNIKRVYSGYLTQQVLTAQAGAAEMDSYYQQVSQIDNLLGDAASGLSSALSGFFDGVQSVSNNPSSISARQSMLSTAQTLVARFQSLDTRLTQIRDGVNAQIVTQAEQISSYATQIADINNRVLLAQAGSMNQQPNDLLDQRDQLIAEVNKLIQVSTVTQSDGSLSVFIGNGQPLVVGSEAYSITAGPAAADPGKTVVMLKGPGGTEVEIPESQLTGGSLGGLISFRNESLNEAQNALGRVALSLATTFNAQHELGLDLNDAMGGEFFHVAEPLTSLANKNNTGSGALTVMLSDSAALDLTTSDYRLGYAGGSYTLTRLSDGTVWSDTSLSALSATAAQGFNIAVAGTPANGDSFLIQPTRRGASSVSVAITDPRAIAAAAPMTTSAASANTGTGSISVGSVDSADPALRDTVEIRFTSASTFDVVDMTTSTTLASAQPYTSGDDISFNGWTVQVSGVPGASDVFTVSSNVLGVSDGRNAVALGALQTSKTMMGSTAGGTLHGTSSYLDAYAQLVSEIGNKTREVKLIGQSQTALADAAVAEQQALSGVNLDEEAANLIRYQQAYQASAKVIDIASKLFDSILAIG